MKKLIITLTLIATMALTLCGCNYQLIDTTYAYDYAIVAMPDGTSKKVEIAKWTDYEGEQLQITSTDGTIYLVSSFNCVLVKE